MKFKLILILFGISNLLFISCNDSDSTIIGNPDGVFQGKIVMFDSTGSNYLNGTIKLAQSNSTDLYGSWSFLNGENGKIVGTINTMKVELNLNPDFIDNNTYLFGDFDGKTIKGNWIHAGIMGINNKGTFVATNY